MLQPNIPLLVVLVLLVAACVKWDKLRLHHAVFCILCGIALGASLWGGDIYSIMVQIAQAIGIGLQNVR